MTDYKLYINKEVYKQIAAELYVSAFFPLLDAMILEEKNPAKQYIIIKSMSDKDELYWTSTGDKEQYKKFKDREINREFEEAILEHPGYSYIKKRRK